MYVNLPIVHIFYIVSNICIIISKTLENFVWCKFLMYLSTQSHGSRLVMNRIETDGNSWMRNMVLSLWNLLLVLLCMFIFPDHKSVCVQ